MPLHHIGSRADLANDPRILIEVGGREIGVIRRDDRFFAFENRCVHQGGPVCEGVLVGRVEEDVDATGRLLRARFSAEDIHLVCPWHGFEFELATGRCVGDRRLRLRRFDVVENDGEVYVDA
jgi:nitrite reductase/ring-hydroxylating ferredoxin subunit